MSADEDVQLLLLQSAVDNSSTNDSSSDEMMAVDTDEMSWSKRSFGEARVIFAVLPPPIIAAGLVVNVLLLILTATRRDGLQRHPAGVYVGALCVCFCGLLVVDAGLQEWASFVSSGPITARAQWLCRGVPFVVGWVRTSACWLAVCALVDRCVVLVDVIRSSAEEAAADLQTTARKNEPSTSAGEVGLLLPTEGGGGSASRNVAAEGDAVGEQEEQPVGRPLPLLCRPVAVMLLTAGAFVAMALANSPLLIRHWIRVRAQPTPRCVVPYRLVRLCTATSYGTTAAPLVASALLFPVVLILFVAAACRSRVRLPDAEDTKLTLVMTSPIAVWLFVVELLRILGRHDVVDNVGGVVHELSDLVFYAVIALVPSLCFVVAPSLRVARRNPEKRDAPAATAAASAAAADETIRLSAVDGNGANDAQ